MTVLIPLDTVTSIRELGPADLDEMRMLLTAADAATSPSELINILNSSGKQVTQLTTSEYLVRSGDINTILRFDRQGILVLKVYKSAPVIGSAMDSA